MKKNIHPKYQQVLFVDSATGTEFLCGSTIVTDEKKTFNGKEYPLCRVSISSASHPFYTGSKQLLDAEGRVDKFKKRYASKTVVKKEEAEEDAQGESKEDPSKSAKKAPAKKAAKK